MSYLWVHGSKSHCVVPESSQNPLRIPVPWVLVPLHLPSVSPVKVWQQRSAVASLWVAPWSPSDFSEFHFHPPCHHFPALTPLWFKYIEGFLFSRLLLIQALDYFFSPLWPREARVTYWTKLNWDLQGVTDPTSTLQEAALFAIKLHLLCSLPPSLESGAKAMVSLGMKYCDCQ